MPKTPREREEEPSNGTTIRITKGTHKALKEVAKKDGVKLFRLVEKILNQWTTQYASNSRRH